MGRLPGILFPILVALSVPAGNDRGPLYTEQLLAAVHQGNPRRIPIHLEIGRHGDRVVIGCRFPEGMRSLLAGQLYAHYPDCRLDPLPDDALDPPPGQRTWSVELRLVPDLFPLKRYPQFEDALLRSTADPLSALLSAVPCGPAVPLWGRITLTVTPAPHRAHTRAERCLRQLALPFFRSHPRLASSYVLLSRSPWTALHPLGWLVGRLAGRETAHPDQALHTSTGRLHEREGDLQAAADKLSRLLFAVRLRLTVSGPPDAAEEARRRLREMAGAFGQFNAARLGSFHPSLVRRAAGRVPWFTPTAFLLSTEELATLWHPPTATVSAPRLVPVESRELAPPVLLPTPHTHPETAVLGRTVFRGTRQRFGILPEDRRRHLAVLGKTGMGKSTLLQHLLASDIAAGRGAGLIDPHGDLAEAVLRSVPRHRTNDVVLFDAGDVSHPLAFNVLAGRSAAERPLVASGVLSAFKKLYADSWGPRLEHILRNALLTLLEIPGTSLVSLLRLLGDAHYRRAVVSTLADPVVRSFWEHEFAGMPPRLQAEAIAPVQNKVGHFVSSPLLRNIVGQARNRLDLRSVLDGGKVLVVNLAKGRVGDDASTLLGSLLVTSLQLAALGRADTPEAGRRDFFLYVDEFQTFATESFATILSEARKYRLALTLANQYLAQVDEATLAAVFGNVGTLAIFQVGAQDAEILADQLGGGLLQEDLLQLPRYRAYVRLLVEGLPSHPFSMETVPPPAGCSDSDRAAIIRRSSRQRYARPVAAVAGEICRAFGGR